MLLQHRSLGVLLDTNLCFVPWLHERVRVGNAKFDEVMYTAMSGGFHAYVVAAQVTAKVVPVTLYAACCSIVAPDAVRELNKMQEQWALKILGCGRRAMVRGRLAAKICGWPYRLGTRLIEEAIVSLARIQLSPPDHPARQVQQIADTIPAVCWSRDIRHLMTTGEFGTISEVIACEAITVEEVESAWRCRLARKSLTRFYRQSVVRPILQAWGSKAFAMSADKWIPCFGLNVCSFLHFPEQFDQELLMMDPCAVRLLCFRVWALARITGKWPMTVCGGEELLDTLPICRCCGAPNISVVHALCSCLHTEGFFGDFAERCVIPDRRHTVPLLSALFGDGAPALQRERHISYVGRSILLCMGDVTTGADDMLQAIEALLTVPLRLLQPRAYTPPSAVCPLRCWQSRSPSLPLDRRPALRKTGGVRGLGAAQAGCVVGLTLPGAREPPACLSV